MSGAAEVKSMLPRLMLRAFESDNMLSGLYPSHCRHWWPLIEDIFFSPAVKSVQDRMFATMLARDEFTTVSLDATCQVCFRLVGQASWRAPADVRRAAAFDDDTSKRKVLTVRGRTGFVSLMKPMANERDQTVADTLSSHLRRPCLLQTRFVFSDDPSANLHGSLKGVMPNLEAVCLDTTHLAMVYEYATWRKRLVVRSSH